MTPFCHPIASALTTVAVFIAMSSAAAQSPQPQRTSVHVQAQIQKSAELQRQALQNVTDPERAEDLINKAYAELQAALSTMIIKASGAKFPDPLFDIQNKRGEQALALLQVARDVLHTNRQGQRPKDQEQDGQPGGSPSYLERVRSNLEQAWRLTSTLAY
jgi:hypothetical protein